MTQGEMEQWKNLTNNSKNSWIEDIATSLNGRGELYYIGGVDGCFMRIMPDGKLMVGTYEGAIPHIGEACFKIGFEKKYASKEEALQEAYSLGGIKFLTDLFSGGQEQEEIIQGMHL